MLINNQIEPAAPDVEDLDKLGKEIVSRIERGDKAKSKSDEHYQAAGLQLIEAKERVPNFEAFLKEHCPNLSRSRAYELIDIAQGKGEEVRAKTRKRTQRHRAKAAQAKSELQQAEPVSATQRTTSKRSGPEWALREFKAATDTYVPIMDAPTKQLALDYVTNKIEVEAPALH